MVGRSFTPEQNINKLREAEVRLSQGTTIREVSKTLIQKARKPTTIP